MNDDRFIVKPVCKGCTDDDCYCDRYRQEDEIVSLAHEVAASIHSMKHADRNARAQIASYTCDGIANALDDIGCTFNHEAFMQAAGFKWDKDMRGWR